MVNDKKIRPSFIMIDPEGILAEDIKAINLMMKLCPGYFERLARKARKYNSSLLVIDTGTIGKINDRKLIK